MFQGKGTTCETATPRPSTPLSLASALLPTNDTFMNCGLKPAARIALMNAAQDL